MIFETRTLFFSLIFYLFLLPISKVYPDGWKSFSKENTDLPSNNILCMAIDDNGTKWFGTDQGLVQFNGENWKLYSKELYPNFTGNRVNDLIFESYGNQSLLWIATENGISLLDITNSEYPTFSIPYNTDNSGLVDDSVNVLTVDLGHAKWFGTFNGLSNIYNDIWSTYSTQNYWIDHDRVVSLDSGPDSMVYIGTEGDGVSRLKIDPVDGITSASALNTTYTGFDEPGEGNLRSNNVYSILIEENGNQWFGTDVGVALHTSYNTRRDWDNFTTEDGLINNFVQAICKENESIIWFGTPAGVSRFDGNSWTNFTSEDGLVNNNVRDIAIDNQGSIWFASEGGISVLTSTTDLPPKK